MIVKNEERYLPDCLKSVQGIADEIVVVDTGSNDRTVEIAEGFGAKVYHFEWINDFSAARNFALSKSTGRWILYMDADERLSAQSVPELKKIISTNIKAACNCYVKSIDDKNGTPNVMQYQRLFYNDKKLRFTGSVHEQIFDSLQREKYRLFNSNIEIIHIGYNVSKAELKVKAERNLQYLLKDYEKEQNAYNTFQLAQTYAVMGTMDKAVEYFKKVLDIDGCQSFYKAHANRFLASQELSAGRHQSALVYALDGLKYDNRQPLLNYIISRIYLKLSDHQKALTHCCISLESNRAAKPSQFEIYISSRLIIYQGLKTAVIAGSAEYFNYFYEALKTEDAGDAGRNTILKLIGMLFNDQTVSDAEIVDYANAVDEDHIELLLCLIDKYRISGAKLKLLANLPLAFRERTDYLNSYAAALYENERHEDAALVYEAALAKGSDDPSAVFYLISVYVTLGQFEKIPVLINTVESKFSSQPEVSSRIQMLKDSLSGIV